MNRRSAATVSPSVGRSAVTESRAGAFPARTITRRPPPAAFTLTELLVVMDILSLLAALLLPSLKSAREKGRAIVCMNNIRQLLLANSLYGNDNNGRLVPCRTVSSYYPWLLEPYVGGTKGTCLKISQLVRCPSQGSNENIFQAWGYPFSIALNLPLAGLEDAGSPPHFMSDFQAPSRTAIFGDETVGWAWSYDWGTGPEVLPYGGRVSFRHSDGMNVGYADGGVRFLRYQEYPGGTSNPAGWYTFWFGTL